MARCAGRYANDFLGPVQVRAGGRALHLTLGPRHVTQELHHWADDDFVFSAPDGFAMEGSLSLARFDLEAGTLWLELYDPEGCGLVQRAQR